MKRGGLQQRCTTTMYEPDLTQHLCGRERITSARAAKRTCTDLLCAHGFASASLALLVSAVAGTSAAGSAKLVASKWPAATCSTLSCVNDTSSENHAPWAQVQLPCWPRFVLVRCWYVVPGLQLE